MLPTIAFLMLFLTVSGFYAYSRSRGGWRELTGALLVMVLLLYSAGIVAFTSKC